MRLFGQFLPLTRVNKRGMRRTHLFDKQSLSVRWHERRVLPEKYSRPVAPA
jgi:hypothetical protein